MSAISTSVTAIPSWVVAPATFAKLRVAREEAKLHSLQSSLRDVVSGELAKLRRDAPAGAASYLSTSEAARRVAVHAATIRAWIAQGVLGSYRAGREIRVRVDELDAAMARMGAASPEEVDLDACAEAIVARGRKR
jgi:excisionase family DNA binding protein